MLITGLSLHGQDNIPKAGDKYILTGGTLISEPGNQSENPGILIEDGLIKQLGNTASHYDAITIKLDSLFIYPGFIAAISNAGLRKQSDSNEQPSVERTGYPPNDVAGITPEKSIRDLYQSRNASIRNMRKIGFTVSHSVPYGRSFPGTGSIISLNGKSFDEAVLKEDYSLFTQWRTARGVFPATVIGIMSKWRELYKNAELAYNHMNTYNSDSNNKARPSHDQATEGLFGVVNGTMPVFFKSESDLEIRRAIQLKKDLGFELIAVEVKMGDAAADQLSEVGGRVLVSLDLPKEAKEKEAGLTDDQKLLLARKKGSITKATQQINVFSNLIPTASFSYLDVKTRDVFKNIRRMIANGLSEDDALASLTTRPANLWFHIRVSHHQQRPF